MNQYINYYLLSLQNCTDLKTNKFITLNSIWTKINLEENYEFR